jgi:hypothetical protein
LTLIFVLLLVMSRRGMFGRFRGNVRLTNMVFDFNRRYVRWNANRERRQRDFAYFNALVEQRRLDHQRRADEGYGRIIWSNPRDQRFVGNYLANLRRGDNIEVTRGNSGPNISRYDVYEDMRVTPNREENVVVTPNRNVPLGDVENPIVIPSPVARQAVVPPNLQFDDFRFDSLSPNPSEDAVPEVVVNQMHQQFLGYVPQVIAVAVAGPGGGPPAPPPPPPPGYNRVKGVFCNYVKRLNRIRKKKGFFPVREATDFWWIVISRRNKYGRVYRRDHYCRGKARIT